MTNKKNKKHHNNHQHNNYNQYVPKVEISEEELLQQCLSLHQLLKDRTNKLRKLQTGDMCYVLSTRWLKDWKDFVGYDATVKEDQRFDKKAYGKRHPGKINIDIIAPSHQSKQFYALPKELKEYDYLNTIIHEKKEKDDDYIAVTQDIWLAFRQHYDGQEIKRPVRKMKGNSIFYDAQPIRCDTVIVNLQRDDLQQSIKKVTKRFYETIFPSQKMQLSTLWTLKQLTIFFKEYCKSLFKHDEIRIWKAYSHLGTYTIVSDLVQSIKDKKYQVKGRLLTQQKYKQLDIDQYLKSTHTLIVEIGHSLNEDPIEGELKGYCEECVQKKPLVISCVCHEVDYCHQRCRIDDQNFHFKSCPQAFDSEDDQQFQLRYEETTPKTGLDNLGNTCYMNSVLQSLFSIEHFRHFFQTNEYLHHLNETEKKENNCRLLRKLSKTIKYLVQQQKSYSPWSLKGQINYNLGAFRGYQQHDANDFLINFLNCVNDYLSKKGEKAYNKILEPFIGQFHSIVVCPHCNVKSENTEIFMQVSVPIKSKVKQQFYYYSIINSVNQCTKGKANLFDTWDQMKKNIGVPPQTLVFMAKEPDGLVLIDQKERTPEKVVKALKGSQLVYYKNLSQIEGEYFFICSLITTKQLSGYKMKSPYGHPGIISLNDTQVTLGTLWLRLIQKFCVNNPEAIAQAQKMQQQYFKQITQTIQAQNQLAKQKMEETKQGEQQQQSDACKKIVQHFNTSLKTFKEKIGFQVYINHFKRSRNVCFFCKKKCQNCQLPIIFDKGFQDFFDQKYHQVRFQVYIKDSLQIVSQNNDLASTGQPTIHDCLSLFNQPEQLDQENAWYCQQCDNMALAFKQLQIKSYPPILILHLNRFKTVEDKRIKNNEPILYNEYETFGKHKYRLISVIVHEGSIDAGHYWSISLRQDKYFIFNDAKVASVQKTFNKNAYILIYSAIDFQP